MKIKIKALILLIGFSIPVGLAAQNAKAINSTYFGSYNYIDNYDQSISSIALILNTNDSAIVTNAKNDLKQSYLNMSGVTIDDSELDLMMDATVANYHTWMAVLDDINSDSDNNGSDPYLLRSIIMNLKKRM